MRALADDVSAGMTRPWADAVRRASLSRLDDLNDRLDAALADTDLGVARIPVWAGFVRVLQWLLILAALGGGAWTARWSRRATWATTGAGLGGVYLPILLLVGGVGLGILLALFCRVLVDAPRAGGPRGRPTAARRVPRSPRSWS